MRPGALLSLTLLAASAVAAAQGCAMCNTTAAQAEVHQRRALNRGILILGIPAALMVGGFAITAYRTERREAVENEDQTSASKRV
ncbi:MAG: hypothetical protein NVS9B15_00860 [Acidobacteriaceae bacterium]